MNIERTHADGRRSIPWGCDAAVAFFARLRVPANVSGGNDHHESSPYRPLHSQNERIPGRRLENRMPQRQVDDVQVQPLLVDDGELDGVNDVTREPLAVAVEHLQADEVCVRGDPLVDLFTAPSGPVLDI